MGILLDVGCGPSGPEEFEGHRSVGVDLCFERTDQDPDKWRVMADVRSLPFKRGSFEGVYASHVLEHLTHQDLLPCLSEWGRVLLPGGVLWLRVPNLAWACQRVLDRGLDAMALRVLFGDGGIEGDPLLLHKTGFTGESILELFQGWEIVGQYVGGDRIFPGEGDGQEIHLWAKKTGDSHDAV